MSDEFEINEVRISMEIAKNCFSEYDLVNYPEEELLGISDVYYDDPIQELKEKIKKDASLLAEVYV